MYKMKKFKKNKFLDGRTITYIADKIGVSREYLSNILNGNIACSKVTATCIVRFRDKDADIEEYFKKIK